MKKLYNKKGKVHPSPPPPSSNSIPADPFALLPAAILALTAALSVQDKEVLAYLISYTNNNSNSTNKAKDAHNDHREPPMSQCDCFRCYKSFWARWDASPNRQIIHEIIEAYEEKLDENNKKRRNAKVKKVRKKKTIEEETKTPVMKEEASNEPEVDGESCDGDDDEVETEKGSSMRRLVSFIGDRIWGVWN